MITFNNNDAYVWVWLPNQIQPVVAGKIEKSNDDYDFYYGKSYIENSQAIALHEKELPLIEKQRFTSPSRLPFVFRDALPDAWGQRLLQHFYHKEILTPLDMLLHSNSDRIGALHFQTDPAIFQLQDENQVTFDQLITVTELIEKGLSIPPELDRALNHGTSIGGARPKAVINNNNKKMIAKFSTSTDIFPIVQAEYAAMQLARKLKLNVANVELIEIKNKYILLVERFDRFTVNDNWARKFMISALTILSLDEMEGRYASYLNLADEIRRCCKQPIITLRELYRRMVFNILIGNTDDHAKNHAFFWDGNMYELTPAYDLCPYPRYGHEATQAMIVGKDGAYSTLKNAISAANRFELSAQEAKDIIKDMVEQTKICWPEACLEAQMTPLQQKQFERAVLNPFIFTE